jgi:hypothetical protein
LKKHLELIKKDEKTYIDRKIFENIASKLSKIPGEDIKSKETPKAEIDKPEKKK